MKIKEQLKGLKSAMDNEFGKVLPNLDPSSVSDFFSAAGDIKRNVEEEDDKVIKKKTKQSKNRINLPITKLPSLSKNIKRKNVNVTITEEQLTFLLKEFTEVMVMCTPWKKCMDDPYGENPETKWFVGRLEYNEFAKEWFPYSQDSLTYRTRKDATQAFFDGLYSKKPLYESKLKGGLADGKTLTDIAKKHDKKGYYHIDNMLPLLKKQLNKGIKIEMEHTNDIALATEIAMDHLYEDPKYYDKLEKIESNEAMGSGSAGGFVGPVGFDPKSNFVKKSFKETPKKIESNEATGSASSGSYETPAAWAKSTSKKHWRGKSKTQIPGGKFVQVKKRCKKFPYCDQGDIKSLTFSNESTLEEAIRNVSEKEGISENIIKQILLDEYYKTK